MEFSESIRNEQLKILLGPAVTSGNAVQILVNGDQIFPAMLDAIRGATETIHFVTYVYWSGEIAREFANAITEKAKEGVECYIILDALGAHRMDDALVDQMRGAGAKVVFYNKLSLKDLSHYLNRTHRKILVTDRKIGFSGGVGIADEWGGDARNESEWHDLHFRVTGPAVAQIFNSFAENWNEIDETEIHFDYLSPDKGDYPIQLLPSSLIHSGSVEDLDVQSFYSSPRDGHFEAYSFYKAAIENASREILIENAYFVPDDEMRDLLISRQRGGIDIKIILPDSKNDSWFARSRSRPIWGELLAAGIEIYRYTPTMAHSKFMIVDDNWVTAGSINFDTVSFKINEESNLNFFGRDFASKMKEIFRYDLQRCRKVTLEDWKNRGIIKRLEETASRAVPVPV